MIIMYDKMAILFYRLINFLKRFYKDGRNRYYKNILDSHKTSYIGDVKLNGSNITLGSHSYINGGYLASSKKAGICIGKWCAIGYNVSIISKTHDVFLPTGPNPLPKKEGNINIGDGVWIGNNVVILPNVDIGDFAVIGANSVVTKNIPAFAVAVGIPCQVKYMKDRERCQKHIDIVNNNLH